jgi:phytol kinase
VLTGFPPLAGMAVVMAACALLLGGVTWWRRAGQPPAELTRKTVHVGMGLIALTLPWVFDRTWPVLVLTGGLALAFVALKLFARQSALGSAMHDIGRSSRGDLYFAASVAALWLLAAGDRLLFVVPVLVLTLGDATAALVGVRYGQIRFDGARTGKSLEGSAALAVVTFLSVHLPLTLSGRAAPLEGILIAATMSVLVVLLEAVAWRGLDNVFVPIGAFLLLRMWLTLDLSSLVARLAVIAVTLGVVLWARTRTTLRDAALAGAALFGYVVWVLGDWRWVVPPLVLFVGYTRVFPPMRPARSGADDASTGEGPGDGATAGALTSRQSDGAIGREHDLHAVGGVVLPALAWLLAARALDVRSAFVPYTATFAAQLAMIGLVQASARGGGGGTARVLATIFTGALVVLPTMLLHRPLGEAPAAVGLALLGAVAAGLAFNRGVSGVAPGLNDEPQWHRQAWWALAASLATLPLLMR